MPKESPRRGLFHRYARRVESFATIGAMEPRFLSLADVTEILQVPMSTVRQLVRSGELRAIQVGGKGTWRVERSEFEAYIERCYAQTEARLEQN